jgi:hypothetical protein
MKIKAISDLIPKLILNSMDSSMIMTNFRASNDSENQLTSNINQNQNEFNEMRNEIITKLFLKLNLENDIETTNNIVNVCIELMENKSILEFIANDEIILGSLFKHLSLNLNENKNLSSYNYKEILILILNLLRFSLIESIKLPNLLETSEDIVNFNCSLDQNKIKNTPLGKLILENISQILQNFLFEKNDENEIANETTFGVKVRALGYKR